MDTIFSTAADLGSIGTLILAVIMRQDEAIKYGVAMRIKA